MYIHVYKYGANIKLCHIYSFSLLLADRNTAIITSTGGK